MYLGNYPYLAPYHKDFLHTLFSKSYFTLFFIGGDDYISCRDIEPSFKKKAQSKGKVMNHRCAQGSGHA